MATQAWPRHPAAGYLGDRIEIEQTAAAPEMTALCRLADEKLFLGARGSSSPFFAGNCLKFARAPTVAACYEKRFGMPPANECGGQAAVERESRTHSQIPQPATSKELDYEAASCDSGVV